MVGRLAKLCPAYLLVDPRAAELEIAEELEPAPLFDWLPPEAQKVASPVVIRCTPANPDSLSVVAGAWGKGAMVCLFSRQPAKEMLSALRAAIRFHGPEEGPPRSILGICWPASMEALLRDGKPEWVQSLKAHFDVALMETDQSKPWQAFSQPEFGKILERLGFAQVEP